MDVVHAPVSWHPTDWRDVGFVCEKQKRRCTTNKEVGHDVDPRVESTGIDKTTSGAASIPNFRNCP